MAERTPSPAMTASARTHVLLAAAACLLPLLLQLPMSLGIGYGLGALAVAAASMRKPLPLLLRLLLGGTALLAVLAVAPGIGRDSACAVLAAMRCQSGGISPSFWRDLATASDAPSPVAPSIVAAATDVRPRCAVSDAPARPPIAPSSWRAPRRFAAARRYAGRPTARHAAPRARRVRIDTRCAPARRP